MLYVLQVICKHQYLYVVCILTFVYKHILHLHYFSPACTYTSRSLSSPTFSPTFISTVTFTTKTTSTTANPTYFGRLHLLQHIIYIIFHRHLLTSRSFTLSKPTCTSTYTSSPMSTSTATSTFTPTPTSTSTSTLHLHVHLNLHSRQHYTFMYT